MTMSSSVLLCVMLFPHFHKNGQRGGNGEHGRDDEIGCAEDHKACDRTDNADERRHALFLRAAGVGEDHHKQGSQHEVKAGGVKALQTGEKMAEDAAIVTEARNMMAELVCREFVVTKNAQNKEDILHFMAYLTSDRAQLIAAQNCNGLPVLNYGFVPTEEELGFAFTEFTRSVYDILDTAIVVDIAKFDKPVNLSVGLSWYKDTTVSGGTLSGNLYIKNALTAEEIYESTLQAFAGTWQDRIEQFLIQQGQ